ncbi:MAG: glycosyltransferase family 2 protein [Chloroflexi bacterium]|nr:glycosyltransferase family 2 protein [Chloroflexota bacterium]
MNESAASPAPLVYLVVLNWNGFSDTDECLQSLRKLAYPRYRTLVVDNASSDDSPARIAAQHPEVDIVSCTTNLGIAAGYNLGIQTALARGADDIIVMNNDLVCDPEIVNEMVATQSAQSDCGIVMPKIYYYAERDIIWSAGAYARWMPSNIVLRGRQKRDGPAYSHSVPLEFAPSCCLLLTRELCERAAFDQHYFFYYDDWDFCVQARKLGYRIMFAPGAHLWHKVSRSTQNSPKSLRWWKILGQSCVRYHRKHHSLGLLALYVAWVLLRETAKRNVKSLPTFLSGIRAGLKARTLAEMRPGWSY